MKEYEVINIGLNENYSKEKGCDTIDVLKKTIVIDDYFFKTYAKEKKEKQSGFFSTAQIFNWVDQNEKWVLTDDDLKYFQSNKSQPMTLKKEKINNDKIKCVLVDKPIFENNPKKFKEISKRILNCRYICEFSTPMFNEDKTIAIIARNEVLVNELNYFIYKLINKQWKLVGYTEHSTE